MKKFISQICNPLEVGSVLTSTVKSMQDDLFFLEDWRLLSYWSVEAKHDMVLLVIEFENGDEEGL